MIAAVYDSKREASSDFVRITEVPRPALRPGHLLLRVLACGVCRTDLHIVEGDLPTILLKLIPGHQIVGEVVGGATAEIPLGQRVGVGWMGVSMAIAGSVHTRWKIFATSPRSPGIPSTAVTLNTPLCGRTL